MFFLITQHASVALIPVNMLSVSCSLSLLPTTITQIVSDWDQMSNLNWLEWEKEVQHTGYSGERWEKWTAVVGKVMNRLVAMRTGG